MQSETFDLSLLPPGRTAAIIALDACGPERERLADLGFAPPQRVKALFKSPAQNPAAYEIMGAVLALRSEDACKIIVRTIGRPEEDPEETLQEKKPAALL